jgi:surface polysaccharide O-acyltransferase-like enzyme
MTHRPPSSLSGRIARPLGLRSPRVDAFRVYAIVFVVLGHSELLLGVSPVDTIHTLQLLLNVVSRAAVPLFLILAGEHLGPRLAGGSGRGVASPYVRRLAILYVLSCLAYWLLDFARLVRSRGVTAGVDGFLARQGDNLLGLLMHGPRPHLWFLVFLILMVAIAAPILKRIRAVHFAFGTAILYGLGLSIGAYQPQPEAQGNTWWYQLLFQAPLFFAIGVVLGHEPQRRSRVTSAVGLIAVGLVIHTIEFVWITQAHGTAPGRLAMLGGTVIYATGVAMLALSPGATPMERRIGRLAPYVPAVYLSHIFFLETLRPPRGALPELLLRIGLPLAATILAFATAWLWYWLRRRFGGRRQSGRLGEASVAP